jgi:hypothetical protein
MRQQKAVSLAPLRILAVLPSAGRFHFQIVDEQLDNHPSTMMLVYRMQIFDTAI